MWIVRYQVFWKYISFDMCSSMQIEIEIVNASEEGKREYSSLFFQIFPTIVYYYLLCHCVNKVSDFHPMLVQYYESYIVAYYLMKCNCKISFRRSILILKYRQNNKTMSEYLWSTVTSKHRRDLKVLTQFIVLLYNILLYCYTITILTF